MLRFDALLGGPGLREGDVLSVGCADDGDWPSGSLLRLQVAAGPDAGHEVEVPGGRHLIGRDENCLLRLADPNVSRRHSSVQIVDGEVVVNDLGSTNGSLIDGVAVPAQGARLRPGQLLAIGESRICVSRGDAVVAATSPGADGRLRLNRPPRSGRPDLVREVLLPERPRTATPERIQWLAALIPGIFGGALALLMHNPLFLAFAALSPLMILGGAAGDRLHWRRSRRQAASTFAQRHAAALIERDAVLAVESQDRRRAQPDPATLSRTARLPDFRLWERQLGDSDLLDVRLGLADRPCLTKIRSGNEIHPPILLRDVPEVVSLRLGPLGLAGPRSISLAVGRWIIVQLAVLHSPTDLEFVLLLSDDVAADWTWARWLPHLGGRVADGQEKREDTTATLLQRLEQPQRQRDDDIDRWTVLVIDRCGQLADLPGLTELLRRGTAVGITALCLDDERRRLPIECASVAQVGGDTGTRLRLNPDLPTPDVLADQVSVGWAEVAARSIAPMVDAKLALTAVIPLQCRLAQILKLGQASSALLRTRWEANDGLSTVLGVGRNGPIAIDLVRDGPHALIAGTTGAGKSELLQSLVVGLAVNSSPRSVSFVLIDYKGGAAFAQCSRLPHTVGMVTDLDAYLARRALNSFEAELRRREQLFADVGAADLDSYRLSTRFHDDPLPRLVIVVDEFAALADDVPDFVTGLVSVAQRGRSLGVHLVLATQRPGGVISPEIRANTTLRIALRVTDPGESADVIGTDDAARIDKSLPGRAFVRTGQELNEIQIARVTETTPLRTPRHTITPLDDWGRAALSPVADQEGPTELVQLVELIRESASGAGLAQPRRPWLPPVPELLPLQELAPAMKPQVVIGTIDRPQRQCREPLTFDLELAEPMLIAGGARSGRSGILRSLAVSSASHYSPAELHVYVVDCAGAALHSLSVLPHCAGVASRDDFGLAHRMLAALDAEMKRRHSQSTERAVRGERLHLLLLIDGWEGFVAAAESYDLGASVELLLRLVREGATAGLTVVLAGDRSALGARLAGSISRKYVLSMSDPADYAIAGLTPRAVPSKLPPGRAIQVADEAEVQFGFLGSTPTPEEQLQAIVKVAEAAEPPRDGWPRRIRALPGLVTLTELGPASPPGIVLGAGGIDANAITVDLFDGDGQWLIAGPPRSGRTTALRTILHQAASAECRVAVVAQPRSALSRDADAARAVALRSDKPYEFARCDRRWLIVVDDVESVTDTPLDECLSRLARLGRDDVAMVVAGRTEDLALIYRGVAAEVRRSRRGVLLQPGPGDGDLLGFRLPRVRELTPPGRGLLICEQLHLPTPDQPIPIQMALP